MHDVIIVGAGPVGGALALAIADADLDVVALDAPRKARHRAATGHSRCRTARG
jgi:2-polyprenyl-6-methoxyphenol hydroxylase-like FAD-dependent oxidoreductase